MPLTYLDSAMIEQPTELVRLSAQNFNADNGNINSLSTYNIFTNNLINNTELFGNLTVYGGITALSGIDVLNTLATVTSSLSVVNIGLGPALYVSQGPSVNGVATFQSSLGELVRINVPEPNIGQSTMVITKSLANRSLSATGTANFEDINAKTCTVTEQLNLTNLDALSGNISLLTNNRINSNIISTGEISANNLVMSNEGVSVFGNMIINGQIFALSGIENISSFITETSTLSVVNTGPGPAFTVKQSPDVGSIASFFGDSVEVLRVNNPSPAPLQPGIVVTGNVYADGGNSTTWNNVANLVLGGNLNGTNIANGAITTAKIVNLAVDNTKLADSSVSESKIASNAVTESKIASNAVIESKIGSNAVTESKIASNAVTESKIASNAVTESKIASNAIVNSKVASNAAIDGTKIVPNFGFQNINTYGNTTTFSITTSALYASGLVAETLSLPTIVDNTLTLDCSKGTVFAVSLNSNVLTTNVLTVPLAPRTLSFTLQISYPDDVVRSVVWPTNTKWANNVPPGLTCLTGKWDTFVFLTWDGGTNWFGFISGQNQ
jgi:hypothetical protein